MSEDTRTEALEQPEYCNVCENFPCLGNHPADVLAWIDNATFIWRGLVTRAELERSMSGYDAGAPFALLYRREAMQEAAQAELCRLAEIQDRAKWIEGIRRRLRLVAEVHRCWVWQSVGLWHWWCLRDSCGAAHHNLLSQPEAFTDALAHTRSFVPQPPEPERWSELDVLAFEAAWDAVQDHQARFAAALPARAAEVAEQVNEVFSGLLPDGMRFEWK